MKDMREEIDSLKQNSDSKQNKKQPPHSLCKIDTSPYKTNKVSSHTLSRKPKSTVHAPVREKLKNRNKSPQSGTNVW